MDKGSFVGNVKKYCALRGVKPTVACRESGAGVNFINKIMTQGSIPSVERVQLLANYLGVTVSELLGESPPGIPALPDPLDPDERQLLHDYRALNAQGQEYVRQTLHMAVQTYKKG